MNRSRIFALAALAALAWAPLHAQEEDQTVPPEEAMKASDVVALVEGREGFRYLDQVRWDQEGYYEIVYFTVDKARVEIKINPVSGNPV